MTIPSPPVQSFAVPGARRTCETGGVIEEQFPQVHCQDGRMLGNPRFAFRYEPLDLLYPALSLMNQKTDLPRPEKATFTIGDANSLCGGV